MKLNSLRWGVITLLLCCFVFIPHQSQTLQSPLQSGESIHDSFDIWNLVFTGLEALGTLLVALLAVFGQRLRSWIVRPKIKLTVGDESPFIEKFEEEDASLAGGRHNFNHIRLEVINEGKVTARNCMVLCDKIYKSRPGGTGFYELKQFVPKEFFWTSKVQRNNVVPKIPSYVNIAEISEPSPSVAGGGVVTPATENKCLQILVEAEGIRGRFFRVENGKLIIPIIIYADNLPHTIKQFIEICWVGLCIQDFSLKNFQVRLLSEADGYSIIGGAK